MPGLIDFCDSLTAPSRQPGKARLYVESGQDLFLLSDDENDRNGYDSSRCNCDDYYCSRIAAAAFPGVFGSDN